MCIRDRCKQTLEEEEDVLNTAQASLEKEQQAVNTLISEKEQQIVAYQGDISNKEAAIKEYEADISAQNATIAALEKAVAADKAKLEEENRLKYDGGMFQIDVYKRQGKGVPADRDGCREGHEADRQLRRRASV